MKEIWNAWCPLASATISRCTGSKKLIRITQRPWCNYGKMFFVIHHSWYVREQLSQSLCSKNYVVQDHKHYWPSFHYKSVRRSYRVNFAEKSTYSNFKKFQLLVFISQMTRDTFYLSLKIVEALHSCSSLNRNQQCPFITLERDTSPGRTIVSRYNHLEIINKYSTSANYLWLSLPPTYKLIVIRESLI